MELKLDQQVKWNCIPGADQWVGTTLDGPVGINYAVINSLLFHVMLNTHFSNSA